MRAHPALVRALGMVKRAAAEANKELGLVDESRADAIIQASQEVIDGKWTQEFVVDVFQAGAGVSLHMNTNEVIANRANEILGGKLGEYAHVHPNDHVNYGQSTNDVFPTAMRLATLLALETLYPVLERSGSDLRGKGKGISRHHEVRPHAYAGCGADAAGAGVCRLRTRDREGQDIPADGLRLRCASWDWAAAPWAPASTPIRITASRRSPILRASRVSSWCRPRTCAGRCNPMPAWAK